MKTKRMSFLSIMITALLTACTGIPEGVEPVKDFKLPKYLGTWYEIARLDHSFERGMSHVTATYSMREDGGVKVVNRGYIDAKSQWKEAIGKAYFVDADDKGYLKVSFFGPFYGSYIVFNLEQPLGLTESLTADPREYQLSYVAGPDTGYLWLLSRTPSVPPEVISAFKSRISKLSFDAEKLILVDQQQPAPKQSAEQ